MPWAACLAAVHPCRDILTVRLTLFVGVHVEDLVRLLPLVPLGIAVERDSDVRRKQRRVRMVFRITCPRVVGAAAHVSMRGTPPNRDSICLRVVEIGPAYWRNNGADMRMRGQDGVGFD